MTPDTTERIGPWCLVERLATGGMGVVWRARHDRTGERVALKTVRAPHPRQVEGIRREVHALLRIRHPGIVRVVDTGLHEGVPWYAMELLEAVTLREHARRLGALDDATDAGGGSTAPLPEVLELVRQLCVPLAFLHGAGLVHRDLKPTNVLVRADGSPVLVDFGVVARFGSLIGREALDVGGGVLGTAAYMAPEQILGELSDARSDLYALGCILYELLTGERPFLGNHPMVLQKHVHALPKRPSALVPGLPYALDELVLRLLAKRPAHRFGYAADVATALDRVLAQLGRAVRPMDGPTPNPYLYRPDLAGRPELDGLTAAMTGPGGLVLITGESGIGRTRLLLEVAAEATRRDLHVIGGQCAPGEGQPLDPLRPAIQAVADAVRQDPSRAEQLLGEHGPMLALFEPSVRALPGQDRPAPDLPARAARAALFRALTETLDALAADGGLVLVLDDLQWADPLTVDWLRSLADRPPRFVVYAAWRSDEATPALRDLVALVGAVELGRLDEAAIRGLVRGALALDHAPETLVRLVHTRSEGNPFFATEILRAALAAGVLSRDSHGRFVLEEGSTTVEIPIPRSLKALVRGRLTRLPGFARKVLEAAAVLGRNAPASLVCALVDLGENAWLDAVDVLERAQALEEAEPGRLRFAHDLLRQLTLDRTDPARRTALHRDAAATLERIGADTPAEIASHWEQAGEIARAVAGYLAAARRAVDQYAYADAERLYRRVIALSPPGRDVVLARGELAQLVLEPQGRFEEAIVEQRRGCDEAAALGLVPEQARGVLGLGRLAHVSGRSPEAVPHYERALELARLCGSALTAGKALNNLALIAREDGRLEEARQLFERDLAIVRALGDGQGEAMTLANIAIVLQDEGRIEEALELNGRAIAMARELGIRLDEAVYLGNRGELHLLRGEAAEARRALEHAVRVHRELANRSGEAMFLITLAPLDPERVEEHLSRAESMLREQDHPSELARCLCVRAELALARGEDASLLIEEAIALTRRCGAGPNSEAMRALRAIGVALV